MMTEAAGTFPPGSGAGVLLVSGVFEPAAVDAVAVGLPVAAVELPFLLSELEPHAEITRKSVAQEAATRFFVIVGNASVYFTMLKCQIYCGRRGQIIIGARRPSPPAIAGLLRQIHSAYRCRCPGCLSLFP